MSEIIGPVHIKERPSSDMQSRIDAEVCIWCSRSLYDGNSEIWKSKLIVMQVVKLLREAYDRVKALLKKVLFLCLFFNF